MLFLMRSKLQIIWDLTFNSMYKFIISLGYLYALAISAIHNDKHSILNQLGVVDGRAYRVTRLVACNKDVYL